MNEYKQIYFTDYWNDVIRPQVIKRDKGICQDCHKLILRKATIHHIIELNDDNYTNYDIAYGLDNLKLVCPKCHNKIHKKGFSKESNDMNYKKETIVNEDLEIDYSKRKD